MAPEQTHAGRLVDHVVEAGRVSGCVSGEQTASRSSCARDVSKPSVPANDRARSRACSWMSRGILRDDYFGQHCVRFAPGRARLANNYLIDVKFGVIVDVPAPILTRDRALLIGVAECGARQGATSCGLKKVGQGPGAFPGSDFQCLRNAICLLSGQAADSASQAAYEGSIPFARSNPRTASTAAAPAVQRPLPCPRHRWTADPVRPFGSARSQN